MKAAVLTFLISMVPVLELRGAIPYGVMEGLSIHEATIIAAIGNMLPVPIIVLFVRKVFEYMRKKSDRLDRFVVKMENKAMSKKDTVEKYEFWGLVLLVAIPLPGTGAWTGSLVAVMMDMRLKRAFPAIALGVLIAAILVSWITFGAKTALS